MKIESWQNAEEKLKWKIVRTDFMTDVPGRIVSADEATGECSLESDGETKSETFGPGGIRIVRCGR